MNIRATLLLVFTLLGAYLTASTDAAAQSSDQVIVNGNPPLTGSIVGKVGALFEKTLDIHFSDEQSERLLRVLIKSWQSKNRAQIDTVVSFATAFDKLGAMAPADRARIVAEFRTRLLKSLEDSPNDELARVVLDAYRSAPGGGTVGGRSAPPAADAGTSSPPARDGLSGIYVGLYNAPPGAAANSVQEAFVTFLPDGHVYWTLPPEGLLNFDPAVAHRAYPDDWGTYKVVGREIQISLGPGLRRVFVMEGGKLKLMPYEGQYRAASNYTFTRLVTGDGLKLNGTFRQSAGLPAISFTASGTFRDEGFTKYFGTIGRPDGSTYHDDARPGTGSYRIAQNTLELRYSDGRVKRFAFTALPEDVSGANARRFRINYEIFKMD